MSRLSVARTVAVFIKEVQQILRDRLTFAMAVGVPILQLVLFGYAINTDPKGLPTAVVVAEPGPLTRSLIAALQNTGYFHVTHSGVGEAQADALIERGEVQFVIQVPPGFERELLRGHLPALLVSVDATDPSASGNAIAALNVVAAQALRHDLVGPLAQPGAAAAPFELRVHRRYNPEGLSRYNIVPGLIGTILTMTMVMLTSLAMTRERERGTLENLLATPVRPVEVMIGKTTPYIIVGAIQVALVLVAARVLFHVPFTGSWPAFFTGVTIFLFANLMLGYLISTAARTQMQAMQMTFFIFLPSILLSGFMFPFRAMPPWARDIGEILPLTHFLRLVRKVVLKGGDFAAVLNDLAPLAAILAVLTTLALVRFRRTLD